MNEHDEPITLEKLFELIKLQADVITQLTKVSNEVHAKVSSMRDNYDYYIVSSRELDKKVEAMNKDVQSIDDDIYWDNYDKEN